MKQSVEDFSETKSCDNSGKFQVGFSKGILGDISRVKFFKGNFSLNVSIMEFLAFDISWWIPGRFFQGILVIFF